MPRASFGDGAAHHAVILTPAGGATTSGGTPVTPPHGAGVVPGSCCNELVCECEGFDNTVCIVRTDYDFDWVNITVRSCGTGC